MSSPATLWPLWIRTVGTEIGMAGEGRSPGCVLGGKGGQAGLKPGLAEVLRGSLTSHPICVEWKRHAKGTSGNSWGSVWGFAMATRPVSIGFGRPAWAWARGHWAGDDRGAGWSVGDTRGWGWAWSSGSSPACHPQLRARQG